MHLMKRIFLTTLLVFPLLHAQDAVIDMAARRQSVVDLKKHIEMREQRLKEIATDIRALDDRTEKRIDLVVDTLKNIKDSNDTKTRINMLKGEVIEGLRKAISIYQTKRRDIFERLRTDKSVSVQALTGDLEKFDARTQKRIDQILELAKSMPARENVDKFESDGGSYMNGWYSESTRISDEWKQNRRQGIATEKSLREIREALEKAISTLESRIASTRDLLKNRKLTDAEREIQKQELGRMDAQLEARRQELLELTVPASKTAAKAPDTSASEDPASGNPFSSAGKDDVTHLQNMLEDARKDISADFWTVLRQYGEAVRERDKILAMKENLEAREKWLAEHADLDKKPQ